MKKIILKNKLIIFLNQSLIIEYKIIFTDYNNKIISYQNNIIWNIIYTIYKSFYIKFICSSIAKGKNISKIKFFILKVSKIKLIIFEELFDHNYNFTKITLF